MSDCAELAACMPDDVFIAAFREEAHGPPCVGCGLPCDPKFTAVFEGEAGPYHVFCGHTVYREACRAAGLHPEWPRTRDGKLKPMERQSG